MKVTVEKITSENCKPYGTLLTKEGNRATFVGDGFSFFKNLDEVLFDGKIGFSIVESSVDLHSKLSWLERHKLSREIIIPSNENIILLLTTGSDAPDMKSLKALLVEKGSAFSVSPNVWHCAPVPYEQNATVFIILSSNTSEVDIEKADIKNVSLILPTTLC